MCYIDVWVHHMTRFSYEAATTGGNKGDGDDNKLQRETEKTGELRRVVVVLRVAETTMGRGVNSGQRIEAGGSGGKTFGHKTDTPQFFHWRIRRKASAVCRQ